MKHLILSLLFLVGCAESSLDVVLGRHANAQRLHYQVFIDPAFPPNIISVIQESVNDWKIALNPVVEFKVLLGRSSCEDGEYVICINMVQHGEIGSGQAGNTFYYGEPEHSLIHISTDNFNPDVANWRECTRVTVTHELGHAMGLSHDQAGTIMSSNGSHVSLFITKRDVKQFIKVHGIR